MAKAKKAKKVPKKKEAPKPKQARLPEMQDAKIEELEALAEKYAEQRDIQRVAAKEQKELRKSIGEAMHKNVKTTYRHEGTFITLLDKSEEVRVKVEKYQDEE